MELNEGLKEQELRDLVHHEIHFDEFQAKMGDDSQVVVISFKVRYKPAAEDFEKFLEKGYDDVLDAETSKSEFQNGWYLVFVEMKRRLSFPATFLSILDDLKNITNLEGDDWIFRYGAARNEAQEFEVTEENLNKIIPLSPKKYRELFDVELEQQDELDAMLMAARVNLPKKGTVLSEEDMQMRILSGLSTNGFTTIKEGLRTRRRG